MYLFLTHSHFDDAHHRIAPTHIATQWQHRARRSLRASARCANMSRHGFVFCVFLFGKPGPLIGGLEPGSHPKPPIQIFWEIWDHPKPWTSTFLRYCLSHTHVGPRQVHPASLTVSVTCLSPKHGCGSKKWYQNGTLANGTKAYLRNPSSLIFSHTHIPTSQP